MVQESLYLLGLRFHARLLKTPLEAPLRLPVADVFVVDAMPQNGETIHLASHVMHASEDRPVLVASEEITDALAFAALSADLRGVIRYGELRQQLPSAVQVLANGGFWIPRHLLVRFLESSLAVARRSRFALARAELSDNDVVLLDTVLSRYSDEQIAEKMRLSSEEVQSGISRLLETFGVRRRDDLALLADQRTIAAHVD